MFFSIFAFYRRDSYSRCIIVDVRVEHFLRNGLIHTSKHFDAMCYHHLAAQGFDAQQFMRHIALKCFESTSYDIRPNDN